MLVVGGAYSPHYLGGWGGKKALPAGGEEGRNQNFQETAKKVCPQSMTPKNTNNEDWFPCAPHMIDVKMLFIVILMLKH